jgi:hypothetical protein
MSETEPTPQQIFEYVRRRAFPNSDDLDEFIIDESLPDSLVEAMYGITAAQALAALEYWRTKTIESVEEIAARYRSSVHDVSENFQRFKQDLESRMRPRS